MPLPGDLDARDQAFFFQFIENKRLKELKRHFFGQPALIELEFRTDDNDRSSRIIDPFAQKVLAEPALLAPERFAQRLERPAIGPQMDPASLPVIEKSVHGLLQHPFFVADDEFGRLEFDELLETVVPVDDAAIQIVQVRCRKTAAVEPDERPEVGRNDGNDVQDHPFRTVA